MIWVYGDGVEKACVSYLRQLLDRHHLS